MAEKEQKGMRRIVILDAGSLGKDTGCWNRLKEVGELEVYKSTSPGETLDRCRGAWAVVTNKVRITEDIISSVPQLRYIGEVATGYDNIDIASASRHGIVVSNVPSYSTESVAQMVFALLLELTNNVAAHWRDVKAGRWSQSRSFTFRINNIVDLAGKTLGILGYGHIGGRVGEIARAFGMKVITNSSRETPAYVRRVSLDELFRESDVLSLNTALTRDNEGIINSATLARMKPTSILINTARGRLVVENDLAHALKNGVIAAAAVDVLNQEPPRDGSPLIGLENCIVTPHIAWQSEESLERLRTTTVENLIAFAAGAPQNVVS